MNCDSKLQKFNSNLIAKGYRVHAFDPLRIESNTEQLREICYSDCKSVLEIGTAGGFLQHCFKIYPDIEFTSIDLSEEFNPNIIGNVIALPFGTDSFDMVVCCQVLEHLPYENFLPSLQEIKRVSRQKAIISLPDSTRRFGIAFCLAKFGYFRFELNPARKSNALKKVDFDICQHYWEIGYKGSLNRDIIKDIDKSGLKIIKKYRLWKHDWHRFYVLQV